MQYPELKFSFNFTDNIVDLVRDDYHMAMRIGDVIDPNYVAIHLCPNRRVVCGTPEYFEKNGLPQTPEDLVQHNCLAFNLQGGQHLGWTFLRDSKPFAIRVNGNLNCNNGKLLYD